MISYVVEQLDEVVLTGGPLSHTVDLMSPFVWREHDTYRIMVRAVPDPLRPGDPTGVIVAGRGGDGLTFALADHLALAPGPGDEDAGGCEDPTVFVRDDGGYLVYFTGVDATRRQGSLLLVAGPTLDALEAKKLVLKAPPDEGNIKEATLARAADGSWRLFYEYAAGGASRIGMAAGPSPAGPWHNLPDPFGIREDSWDNWHLSTGPIIQLAGHDPVMFYNGATHDARWRIGWVSFDAGFTHVTGRGIEPMLVPPPPVDRTSTDIAFAASTVTEGDRIALYFSLEDRKLRRALVARYHR